MFRAVVLEIKTASLIFHELVDYVILPGEEGELSILDFHQPIVAKLKKGIIKTGKISIAIKKGIAKMTNNELVILAEK